MDNLFPRGTFKHHFHHDTKSIREILSTLHMQHFDGCLHTTVENGNNVFEGYLLIKDGDVHAAMYEDWLCDDALSRMIDEIENNDGAIDVYEYNFSELKFAIEFASDMNAIMTNGKNKENNKTSIHVGVDTIAQEVSSDKKKVQEIKSESNEKIIPDSFNQLPEIKYNVTIDENANNDDGAISFLQVLKNNSDFIANINIEVESGSENECRSICLNPNTIKKFMYKLDKENRGDEVVFKVLSDDVQLIEKHILLKKPMEATLPKSMDYSDLNEDPLYQEIANKIGFDFIEKIKNMPKIRTNQE